MARRPYEPEPWLREAIVESRAHHLEALASASERFAEHHHIGRPDGAGKRAADYRVQAAEFRAWAFSAGRPRLELSAADLWSALYRARADDELMSQVAALGREHSRPDRPCRFRLDEHDELHLLLPTTPDERTNP